MRREVKIGLFAVLMIAAFWAGGRFLKGFDLLSRNAVYYAAYDAVDGVQNASHVMIRGVKVGKVTKIILDPVHEGKVVLQLTIQRKYRLPSDSEARIFSYSIMSGKAIAIELGSSPQYLVKGDTLRSGVSRDLMDVAGSELDFFKQKLSQVTADVTRTMDNVNMILEQNAGSLAGTMSHLNSITGEVSDLLVTQRGNLNDAVSNLSRFSKTLGENSPRVDSIMMHLSDVSGQLARADLERTLADIDAIVSRIESGDGTLGALVNDDQLYKSLTEASENLTSLLADVEAYPKRYFSLGSGKRADKQRRRDMERKNYDLP